ncbi:MAG: hypothetical protein ABIE07_08280 [Candidatus Zixiibacteriota bacterium]
MTKMLFSFNAYNKLIELILESSRTILGIEKFLINRKSEAANAERLVAIRHDVDYSPARALKMARIEAKYQINTTYYIRRRFFDNNLDIIKQIAQLGHEIGYHYEEVDTHQKAPNKQVARDAVGFFIGSLLDLDKLGFNIKTICAHGNPLSGVDNRQVVHLTRSDDWLDDLAFTYDRDLIVEKISNRLIGDASIDITGDDFDVYIPDTGRFNPRYNLKDHIDNCPTVGLSNFNSLKEILENRKYRRIYMNMHPDRWSDNKIVWLYDLALDTGKNFVKLLMGKSGYKGKLIGDKIKDGG